MLSPELIEKLVEFRRERDWEQFHTSGAGECLENLRDMR